MKDGATRVLFARDGVPGFNDLFTDAQGRVYTGSLRADPFRPTGDRAVGECYRIDAEGRATELYGGVSLSNGVSFSPEGDRIYHCDTARSRHDLAVVRLLGRDSLPQLEGPQRTRPVGSWTSGPARASTPLRCDAGACMPIEHLTSDTLVLHSEPREL